MHAAPLVIVGVGALPLHTRRMEESACVVIYGETAPGFVENTEGENTDISKFNEQLWYWVNTTKGQKDYYAYPYVSFEMCKVVLQSIHKLSNA